MSSSATRKIGRSSRGFEVGGLKGISSGEGRETGTRMGEEDGDARYERTEEVEA